MGKPKIRFEGYTDDWEQRKLGECVSITSGEAPSKFEEGIELYVKVDDLNYNDKYIVDTQNKVSEHSTVKRVTKGSVVFPKRGAAIMTNKVRIMGIDSYMDTNMMALTSEKLDSEFLYNIISKEGLYKIADTSTIPQINNKHIEPYEVTIPSLDEQRLIGECFRNLDHLITLHQRKCEEIKTVKKYMLQKMFPKNGQTIPEIRFSGFTDDWEQRKLPEFVSFFNGLTYTPDDVQETGTLVLRSSNVKNGEIVDADNVYVSDKVATSENVQDGDIIVVVRNGSRALIGKHAQVKASMPNTVIGAFMSGIRSEHSSFVNALLDTSAFENEISKNMGATINQITGYMFSKMEFMIPSEEEQQRIGDYFSNLDHLITLHQRKYFCTGKSTIIYYNKHDYTNKGDDYGRIRVNDRTETHRSVGLW